MKPTTDEVLAWADQVGMAYLKHIEQNSMQQVLEYTALAYAAGAAAMKERCIEIVARNGGSIEIEAAIRALGGDDEIS